MACNSGQDQKTVEDISIVIDQIHVENHAPDSTVVFSALESKMISANLLDVQWLNADIIVDLKYSTTDNFLNQKIYEGLSNAYLEEKTAKMLAVAQYRLSQTNPGYKLKIWDAARPVSCQQLMWNVLKMPAGEKGRFVSNPKNHSLHNYGCAVDLTIVNDDSTELDMGTKFDQFDSLAQPKYEMYLLSQGRLSKQQIQNRNLLRSTLIAAGFRTISSEWWHFNGCSREYAKSQYRLVE